MSYNKEYCTKWCNCSEDGNILVEDNARLLEISCCHVETDYVDPQTVVAYEAIYTLSDGDKLTVLLFCQGPFNDSTRRLTNKCS